jgi:CBS domain-containing protein
MRAKHAAPSTASLASPEHRADHTLDTGGSPSAAAQLASGAPSASGGATQEQEYQAAAARRPHEPAPMSGKSASPEQRTSADDLQAQSSALSKPCRELMSENPVCCLPSDTIDLAARLMVTEDIGALPVVMDLQTVKLVGIVTDRDLAVKAVAEGCDPRVTTVEDVMTYEPMTCHAEDSVQHVVDLMAEHQVRRLPVVDQDGRLIGIIAQADIATRLQEPRMTAWMVEEVSKSTLRSDRMSETPH